MLGVHGWIHTITVLGFAILTKEYMELRTHCGYLLRHVEGNTSKIEHIDFTDAVLFDIDDHIDTGMGVAATTVPPPVAMGHGNLATEGSSVWCSGSNTTSRICRFKDLCYLPSENSFVFFHGNNSYYEGLPSNRFEPALLDLSSVADHNMQYFNFVDLPAERIKDHEVRFVSDTSLLFNRFNPDNLMHVFHDDLLPMFHTLRLITGLSNFTSDPFHAQLVFTEGWEEGDNMDLYSVFSSLKPLMLSDVKNRGLMTCFNDAVVGLSKTTTWYQYGFREPQGPIKGHKVTGHEIHHFTSYVKHHLAIENLVLSDNGEDYVVLLSRRGNRLMLNEMDLSLALVKELKRKVLIVSAETHTLSEMIAILEKASVMVGMHGSLFALAMFMKPGSAIVELFPYAVNPEHYTPYKTLANLPGMGLTYKAWQNTDPAKTETHPERGWETGGIAHLPQAEQLRIKTSREVPKHLCCRNPEWLFRIYQDTSVDIPAVLSLVRQSLQERESRLQSYTPLDDIINDRIYPSEIRNLKCSKDPKSIPDDGQPTAAPPMLSLAWDAPWNLPYLTGNDAKYEVWIQETGEDDYTAWILGKTSHHFTGGLKPDTNYNIWVRCIVKDTVKGPFNTEVVSCST